jgi:hypothetical protein
MSVTRPESSAYVPPTPLRHPRMGAVGNGGVGEGAGGGGGEEEEGLGGLVNAVLGEDLLQGARLFDAEDSILGNPWQV